MFEAIDSLVSLALDLKRDDSTIGYLSRSRKLIPSINIQVFEENTQVQVALYHLQYKFCSAESTFLDKYTIVRSSRSHLFKSTCFLQKSHMNQHELKISFSSYQMRKIQQILQLFSAVRSPFHTWCSIYANQYLTLIILLILLKLY